MEDKKIAVNIGDVSTEGKMVLAIVVTEVHEDSAESSLIIEGYAGPRELVALLEVMDKAKDRLIEELVKITTKAIEELEDEDESIR